MTHNYGVHRKSKAPGNIIADSRQRVADEISEKHLAVEEKEAKSELKLLKALTGNNAEDEFDNSGDNCSQSYTGNAEFRCTEKAKNKHSIEDDIKHKGSGIDNSTCLYLTHSLHST